MLREDILRMEGECKWFLLSESSHQISFISVAPRIGVNSVPELMVWMEPPDSAIKIFIVVTPLQEH
jgi:hypothetical protein